VGHLETVTSANADEALAYLAQRPYDNVYVHWLLASGAIASGAELVLWRDGTGSVRGACYYGMQIVVAADEDRATDAFATRLRRGRAGRMIVGPRRTVERFWRTAQRFTRADATVAPARLDELDEIVPNSAQMIAGEVGGDPRRTNADFRGRTARIVERGWLWRSRLCGRLVFMCNIGSQMPQTAQLQGVWTPPAMRGHGHASRALGAICDNLLDAWPTLSLYVNAFNAPAVALYERVGFTRAGEFATILFA